MSGKNDGDEKKKIQGFKDFKKRKYLNVKLRKKGYMYIHTEEFTKRFQLFVTLYTLSIYPSAYNHMRSLRRHLPNTFHKFPCTKMQSNHYCKHCKLIMSNNYIHSSIHYYYILLTMYIISHILFYLLVRPRL